MIPVMDENFRDGLLILLVVVFGMFLFMVATDAIKYAISGWADLGLKYAYEGETEAFQGVIIQDFETRVCKHAAVQGYYVGVSDEGLYLDGSQPLFGAFWCKPLLIPWDELKFGSPRHKWYSDMPMLIPEGLPKCGIFPSRQLLKHIQNTGRIEPTSTDSNNN